MRCVSSQLTFYYKRVFPVVWFGGLIMIGVVGAFAHSSSGFSPFLIVVPIMLVLGYRFMKKFIFDLVDEVWDDDNSLLVTANGQSERIALGDITNVNYSTTMNPPRVVLSLRRPTLLGKQIAFCAPVQILPFSTSPVIDDLIGRIGAAREKHGR
jgi:hypothetical protein